MTDFQDTLRQFDSEAHREYFARGDRERAQFLERFPLKRWPAMKLTVSHETPASPSRI